MFGQISLDVILLFMLYGVGAAVAAGACLYLVLRRANAFAPEVTPPVRLRRWTAAFFAVLAIGHLWYLPAAVLTDEDFTVCMLVSGLLDCVTVIPLVTVLLLCMLQDRQRPLWPVGVMTAPLVVLIVAGIVNRSEAYIPMVYGYLLLLGIGLIAYMVRAVRQYGRWLRENFADLEHKEVWLSHTLLLLLLLLVVVYGFAADDPSFFLIRIADFVLFGLLLWRVETLPQLEEQENQTQPQPLPVGMSVVSPSAEELERKTTTDETEIIGEKSIAPAPSQGGSGGESPVSIDLDQIEQLLKKHCADTQLYLQPDLTLPQLASAIGTNRSYLSQYFSRQSITYNTYINNLRINYFVSRCQEAAKAGQPIVAQQLAEESGFSTYRTFSRAFMLRTGQSVSTWMRETGGVIM